jgi:Outer membrane lipoprotein carrier protein LolA
MSAVLALYALGSAADVDAFLARLAAAGKDLHALSGEFTQQKRVAAFKQVLTSHGRFVFRRPAYLEWRYLDPDPSVLTVAGERATVALPDEPFHTYDLAQQPVLRAILRQLQMWLGGGAGADPAQIKADYAVSAAERGLHLVPRDPKLHARITALDVTFEERTLLPRSVRVSEVGGDVTTIIFSGLKKK